MRAAHLASKLAPRERVLRLTLRPSRHSRGRADEAAPESSSARVGKGAEHNWRAWLGIYGLAVLVLSALTGLSAWMRHRGVGTATVLATDISLAGGLSAGVAWWARRRWHHVPGGTRGTQR
jgi:hypothetical protein